MTQFNRQIARITLSAITVLFGFAYDVSLAAALRLTGEQEVPPVITSASASGEFTIASDGLISGSITTHGIAGTMAHIHQGAVGTNGPVVITLTKGDGGTWFVPPATRLSADQQDLYRSGKLYVNVHTDMNKGGEVRAQLIP